MHPHVEHIVDDLERQSEFGRRTVDRINLRIGPAAHHRACRRGCAD
jgi:hypothetical protein